MYLYLIQMTPRIWKKVLLYKIESAQIQRVILPWNWNFDKAKSLGHIIIMFNLYNIKRGYVLKIHYRWAVWDSNWFSTNQKFFWGFFFYVKKIYQKLLITHCTSKKYPSTVWISKRLFKIKYIFDVCFFVHREYFMRN